MLISRAPWGMLTPEKRSHVAPTRVLHRPFSSIVACCARRALEVSSPYASSQIGRFLVAFVTGCRPSRLCMVLCGRLTCWQ